MDIFISYSSKDQAIAVAACGALESSGLKCWIAPRDIQPGSDWGAAIIGGIEASRLLLLVFSENANASQQVLREVERAIAKGLPIIPLRVEQVRPSRGLEYFISSQHWLDASTPPLKQHFSRMVASARALLVASPSDGALPVGTPEEAVSSPSSGQRRWMLLGAGAVALVAIMAAAVASREKSGAGDNGPPADGPTRTQSSASSGAAPSADLYDRAYERVIHERFPRWDADSDGHLSLPEATARLVKAGVPARGILPIVQRLDADHDGKLSERELLEMGKAVVESRDQDGDNRYSVAELLAWHRETGGDVQIKKAKSVFKNNDSDHDGFVSVPEMEAALSEILKSDH